MRANLKVTEWPKRGTGNNPEVRHRTEPLSPQATLRAGGPRRTTETAGVTVDISESRGPPVNEAVAQEK